MNDEERLTARGLLTLSREYIDAYSVLEEKNPRITYSFHVKFYLLAHSIELSFKAYLKHNGSSERELRNLGHDLEEIYTNLSTNYLYRLDERAQEMIRIINAYYRNKEFEYPKTGVKNVVSITDLATVASLINNSTEIQLNQL